MTTRVSAPRSSKVTVVTAPSSPPSSFVQTRRECSITSLYRPKNAMGSGEAGWLNTKRYVPPIAGVVLHYELALQRLELLARQVWLK